MHEVNGGWTVRRQDRRGHSGYNKNREQQNSNNRQGLLTGARAKSVENSGRSQNHYDGNDSATVIRIRVISNGEHFG